MEEDTDARLPSCFIAMPITTRPEDEEKYGDPDHWVHVSKVLFEPAIRAAGLEPVVPLAKGSELIHSNIIERLTSADMVLVDLSSSNPNVYFEFGVRTAMNKPVTLVAESGQQLPFDTKIVNTYFYDPTLTSWELDDARQLLTSHIRAAIETCSEKNPMWERFGLEVQAQTLPMSAANPADAALQTILAKIEELGAQTRNPEEEQLLFQGLSASSGRLSPHWRDGGSSAQRFASLIRSRKIEGVLGVEIEDDRVVRVLHDERATHLRRTLMALAEEQGALVTFTLTDHYRGRRIRAKRVGDDIISP